MRNRNGLCFAPDGDPLAGGGGGNNNPDPPRTRKLKCEFCDTELATSGDYLKLSDKAKKLRGLEEANEKQEAIITSLRTEIETLKARLTPEPARQHARLND